MRIAFGDFSGWDFHVRSVETMPLGGSQSAACYLAQALAVDHDVFFLSRTTTPGQHANVTCLSWSQTAVESLAALRLDVFVGVSEAGHGRLLREALGPETRLVLWTQHRIDQPAVQPLAEPVERASYDGFALVSEWQCEEFRLGFGLAPARTQVLGNGVAPAFADLFPDGQPILPQKARPPVLAYTSTPFRGLHLLVEAFPAIRAQIPEARLRIFSSMAVYQMSPAEDQAQFGALYQRCRQTPGIEYVGSLPQPALAREMRGVSVLAYPNTFPETFCIAALEAMAGGCRVVTSAQGALPETTAGFAELIPVGRGRVPDARVFVERTVGAVREMESGDPVVEEALRRQVQYVRQNATWAIRAGQWGDWLRRLCDGAGG
ncbi:MAG: glycosyltransferase family 4 protein [Chthoniobacter sp.]